MINSKYKDDIKQEYNHLLTELTISIEEIDKDIQLQVILHGKTKRKADLFLIDFEPSTLSEESQFQNFLVIESLLRGIDIVQKSREELRSVLKVKLGQYAILRRLPARLKHCFL